MTDPSSQPISPIGRSTHSSSPGSLSPGDSRSISGNREVTAGQNTVDMIESPSQLSAGTGIEARDYMNGGLPHEISAISGGNYSAWQGSTKQQIQKKAPGSSSLSQDALADLAEAPSPPGRRSVQFARPGDDIDISGSPKNPAEDETFTTGKDWKSLSLISKLKALTLPTGLQPHTRSQSISNISVGDTSASVPQTPTTRRPSGTLHEEESDADADAEETADEGGFLDAIRDRRRRRVRRAPGYGPQTAPSSPYPRTEETREPSMVSNPRTYNIVRRSTMPNNALSERAGMSEGEGRDHLGRQSAWRRGSSWVGGNRGQSYNGSQHAEGDAVPSARRPSNFRRLTGFGAGSDGDVQSPRRPFLGAERATTFGAARWKMLKHGLKMLGQKKDEHKIDYLKSAELMAELRAGAPAALMLASMIQRDEHGNRRIPVLLEQLKLRITDSRSTDDTKETERHLIFRIELEYGSGTGRMKWVIDRSLRDFVNLHLRYKLQTSSDKYIQLRSDVDSRPKQPRFPKTAFPYLRGIRGLGESEEDEGDAIRVDDTVGEATHSETERLAKRKKRRPSLVNGRRRSSMVNSDSFATGQTGDVMAALNAKKAYNEKQRRRLETYLQEMIRWLIFRADSNRLCKFLELSALGVRLSAEGGYHGKEGFLVIQNTRGLDFRRMLHVAPKTVFQRHSPKWFLVRSNYIVCIDSPENMHIYDVFLLDSKFEIETKHRKIKDSGTVKLASSAKSKARPQHHRLKLHNSERRLKLLAKNERMLNQFEESIKHMVTTSLWSKPNRFDSFAPVRKGVFAQWLVDGRDYMWNVSRAINEAKDVIYIHDWWLSPQLYMRRPAAISQKWRLDRLLRKKAREGVKVFIIIYRNVEAAVPIDSEYTKFSMLDLHPNIFVQRSPNQYKKNQFFFAHHEKICIVDHSVAFVGGIDLCFGRWDTPQHPVSDDKPTGFEPSDDPKDAEHCQLWPGKDYSNPRVQDFYQLSEPYAEMYDRSKTPRMPWHDISMQVVGQPARDLTRHFIQRWNYVLRGRTPTRPTPCLLPPPDYLPAELEAVGMNGTCEVQILRSASNWSLGLEETEHSIMNAYCKMIEESEHFVYIENQFFITSCDTMNVKIVNKIGDAIVERAIRAFKNNESWRCVVIIPLMPGFQNTVDAADGTSVRLIMQCQFRSINRGESSIFGRLKAEGIEPEEFISFYSLRAWGKIGPNKMLVTEQLYIHAKVIIVDDRTALIGSANINERSMLGIRDSECAAVVRDTDMIWSTMDGEPYLVGRFAHSLRMRLMREHLGLDVDAIMEEERGDELDREEGDFEADMDNVYAGGSDDENDHVESTRETREEEFRVAAIAKQESHRSFNHDVDWEQADNPNIISEKNYVTSDKRVTGNQKHAQEVDGEGKDHWKDAEASGIVRGRDSVLVGGIREVLVTDIAAEWKGTVDNPRQPHLRVIPPRNDDNRETLTSPSCEALPPMPSFPRRTTEQLGLPQLSQLPALPVIDDTDIGGPPVLKDFSGFRLPTDNPLLADIKRADVTRDCMKDPLNDSFFEDTWRRVAENNTKIFRRVFRCNPDNEVTNWHEYTEFQAYAERFSQAQNGTKSQAREEQESSKSKSGPPGAGTTLPEKVNAHGRSEHGEHPLGTVAEWAASAEKENQSRNDTFDAPAETQPIENISNEKAPQIFSSGADAPSPALSHFPSFNGTVSNGNHVTNTQITQQNAEKSSERRTTFSTGNAEKVDTIPSPNVPSNQGSQKRRRRATTKSRKGFSASDDLISRADAEALLGAVQGSLVVFPYDWLKVEEHNSNWLYQVDMVAPLQIYD